MILCRPSEHFKKYADMQEIGTNEDDDYQYANAPDSFLDNNHDKLYHNKIYNTFNDNMKENKTDLHQSSDNNENENDDDDEEHKPKSALETTLDIIDGNDTDQKLTSQKME